MKQLINLFRISSLLVVAAIAGRACADGHVNPGFEQPVVDRGAYKLTRNVPGWHTTADVFEVWSSGFGGVDAFEGNQFVELNAEHEGVLYQDTSGIPEGSVLEFSFAHRGRNGDDTMALTIIDLGKDNELGGDNDVVLFHKTYTTGKDGWALYDSKTEPKITAVGNTLRFAYMAVEATNGDGPPNTEGNFLDAADFGVGVVTAKKRAYGAKRLHTFGISGQGSMNHYLGSRDGRVGISDETDPASGSIFVFNVQEARGAALLTNKAGKYLTARGTEVVLTDSAEPGSYWQVRDPLLPQLHVNDGWFSLESVSEPGRFLRHYLFEAHSKRLAECSRREARNFLADASWRFVDADGLFLEGSLDPADRKFNAGEYFEEYTFRGQNGRTAILDLNSEDFDTYLWVAAPEGYDSDGNGKDDRYTNDDRAKPDTNSLIEVTLPAEGVYRVNVSSHDGGETGDYTLLTSSQSAPSIGRHDDGTLASGDRKNKDGSFRDDYEFRGPKGADVTLVLISEEFDTHLQLRDPSGKVIAVNDNLQRRDTNSHLEIPLVDGEYRVRVTSHKPMEVGDFTLSISYE